MKLQTLLFFVCILVELKCEESLLFVNVIFRHGNRTPDEFNFYPDSPYLNESLYEPYGYGELTNKGKLTSYNVGRALRDRYNGFLDEKYNIKVIDARSSDYSRTKTSLQAMLAGLFPPSQELIWLEGFDWQPIPYTYVEQYLDKELYFFLCPNWYRELPKYLASEEGQERLSQHRWIFEYIKEKTGQEYSLWKICPIYLGFEMLEELNFTLPNWTAEIYPLPMKNILLMYYDIMTTTKPLRQMSAGYLLKKILSDTQEKIDGKIPEKKISVWCGHEVNIATVLSILKVWDKKDIPSYGSYILMELHRINQEYGFKIFYSTDQSEPKLLKIPGCEEFCPLNKFNVLMEDIVPASDEICGKASASRLFGIIWILSILQLSHYWTKTFLKSI